MKEQAAETGRMVRAAACAALLFAMAVSGVIAVGTPEKDNVFVPTVSINMSDQELSAMAIKSIRDRLQQQRERELLLLDEVIERSSPGEQSADEALAQKLDIIQRMEYEAQAQACLDNMGFERTAVLCGAQNVTVFAPFEYSGDEKSRISMIDALSSLTGVGVESVKIILAKK